MGTGARRASGLRLGHEGRLAGLLRRARLEPVSFIRFATDQTRPTTLALLAECIEEVGGVPAVLLTDRMGCLRASTVANVVVPTRSMCSSALGMRADQISVKRRIPSRRASSSTWPGMRKPTW